MPADSTLALNIALMIVALVFLAAAGMVVAIPALHAQAAILLPLMVMAGLVATPFAVWAINRGRRPNRLVAL